MPRRTTQEKLNKGTAFRAAKKAEYRWTGDGDFRNLGQLWAIGPTIEKCGPQGAPAMDVLYFLRERTKFIRWFYEAAGGPFVETIRKIEARESPFDDPPYSEDGEPPFLEEFIEADTALEVVGRTCVSMLSGSLQLYFSTWERELRVTWKPGEKKKAFESGFIRGYRACFEEVLNASWNDCPANLEILEQVTLARNRDQHPDHIHTMSVSHSHNDRTKYPNLFFVSETERRLYCEGSLADIAWMTPPVSVSRDNLIAAIDQVEMLAEWLEPQMFAALYRA
jgi:hypothetical protein